MLHLHLRLVAAAAVVPTARARDLLDGRARPCLSGARLPLTPLELAYCCSRPRPEQHVAGRLAAKQAVRSLLRREGQGWHDGEAFEVAPGAPVIPSAPGWAPGRRPTCRAVDDEPPLADALTAVRVSISHHGDLAVAAAVTVDDPDAEDPDDPPDPTSTRSTR